MQTGILELTRIIQKIVLSESPAEQMQQIVDSISQSLESDVCSLYRQMPNGDLLLQASHGLVPQGKVRIPAGQGLVGRVANSKHPLNVADALSEPGFFYVADSQEEQFPSFCGVPLVRFGQVIGVLVVQRQIPRKLSDESEAFLVTLASQLALIIADLPLPDQRPSARNIRYPGIKASPGIGMGRIHLCESSNLNNVPDAPCADVETATQQWHELLELAKADIKAEQAALGDEAADSISGIFDAYRLLLSDQALTDKVVSELNAGHWLPMALRLAIQHFAELFAKMEDPYLRARSEDIQHLGHKLFNVWRGSSVRDSFENGSDEPVVLVGQQVSVSDIAAVPSEQLAGIICFEGARLSHAAILANALGVPAVMGVGVIKKIQSGDKVVVDGNLGHIFLHPTEAVRNEFRRLIEQAEDFSHQLDALRELPAITPDGIQVRLMSNTGLIADISPGLRHGAEGIGLYRTEIPFIVRDSFPTEEEQIHLYRKVLKAYSGKPVHMRILDIGGDKQLPYFPIQAEENPALGWRGIRFTLDNIQLLMTQVRAMVRAAAGEHDLHILLPMISSTEELDTFCQLLDDACAQLRGEGYTISRPKLGIMVEVPAAISLLPFWKDRLDFISIGSNDLSQYLLAMDRNNAHVAKRYDHLHPAVLHEIYRIATTARQCQMPVSLCGEMASDPVAVVLLLGMGIRSLSMSSAQLPRIKWLIRSTPLRDAERLLQQALQTDNVSQIRALGEQLLNDLEIPELARR